MITHIVKDILNLKLCYAYGSKSNYYKPSLISIYLFIHSLTNVWSLLNNSNLFKFEFSVIMYVYIYKHNKSVFLKNNTLLGLLLKSI